MTYEKAKQLFYNNEEIMKEEFNFWEIDNFFAKMDIIISDINAITKEKEKEFKK